MGHAQPLHNQRYPKGSPSAELYADHNNHSGAGKIGGLRFYTFDIPNCSSQSEMFSGKYVGEGQEPTSTSLPLSSNLDVGQYVHTNENTCTSSGIRYTPYNYNRACASAANTFNVSGQSLLCSYMQPQRRQAAAAPNQTCQPYVPLYQQTSYSALQQTTFLSAAAIQDNALAKSSFAIPGTKCAVADITFINGIINLNTPLMVLPMSSPITTALAPSKINGGKGGDIEEHSLAKLKEASDAVTLQITNLDYSLDESSLRSFLMNQLKPITPVVSLVFEGSSYAKVTVPDLYCSIDIPVTCHDRPSGCLSVHMNAKISETIKARKLQLGMSIPKPSVPIYT
ncbi:uncharacterized protein LOC119562567 [Drosophila subpulchrella]|uniref:uncharacterized protein LOC119562567 n=1 Tax=Drosophila subpulchrella TaxID=1486046 RepID=UPI0018A189F1|nr:uncharacterized protein LOC119562567 [Drosophila subpulchrella]